MPITFEDVWSRTFHLNGLDICDDNNDDFRTLCSNIATARNTDCISRNQVSNLLRGIRRDISNDDASWEILLRNRNFSEFLENVDNYQSIRAKFKSRDKEPLDPMCVPYSNEIMFGKGLNSKVKDAYFENQ